MKHLGPHVVSRSKKAIGGRVKPKLTTYRVILSDGTFVKDFVGVIEDGIGNDAQKFCYEYNYHGPEFMDATYYLLKDEKKVLANLTDCYGNPTPRKRVKTKREK